MSSDSGSSKEFVDRTIQIKRCAAVVKGGRRFSFAAMVVVGDGKGRVGWGYGKANEVPPAVEKGTKQATRSLVTVPVTDGTIPHPVRAKYGSATVMLFPAGPGTGVIAGAAVRAVCEAAGITNIITKSLGTSNQITVVKAAIDALKKLRTTADIERLRGVTL